jgi:hypothetical protein
MSTYEFKRLNVITAFNEKVQRCFAEEFYRLRIYGRLKYCIVVQPDTPLNEREKKDIVETFKAKKSYNCRFFTVGEVLEGKAIFGFSEHKDTLKSFFFGENLPEETVLFIVERSRF